MIAWNLPGSEAMAGSRIPPERDEVLPFAPDGGRETAQTGDAGIAGDRSLAGAGSICSGDAVMAASQNLGRSSTPDFIVWNS